MDQTNTTMAVEDVLPFALCAGLCAAVGELLALATRKLVFHEVLRMSMSVVWMAALSDAVFFGLIAAVLALIVVSMRRIWALRVVLACLAAVAGVAVADLLGEQPRVIRLAAAVIVAVAGTIVLERIISRAGARRAALFVCASAAAYAVMLAIPPLHWFARVAVALGVGARITSVTYASPGLERRARRLALGLAACFVIAGAAIGTWNLMSERRALANLPAPAVGARNVLLIIWDTARAASLSLYGNARETTPVLTRLAATSTTFDWAFSTAPWTLPSHASIFTGHFPHELSANVRVPLDAEFPTIAERLGAEGFRTAGFVANGFYVSEENGLARGFQHFEDFVLSPGEVMIASSFGRALANVPRLRKLTGFYNVVASRNADDISAAFLHWLGREPARPFFAFLNFMDAHEPYLPPEPWRSKFGSQGSRQLALIDHSRTRASERPARGRMSRQEKQAELDAYEGALSYLDDRLGMLLDSLQRRGLLDNTVVIVSSDHGEHHGEHNGIFMHAQSLYTQEVHVPLVIRTPDDLAARRVATPVSLRDLPASIVSLAHARTASSFPGHTLERYWRATAAGVDTVLSEQRPRHLSSIVAGRHHLIVEGTKPPMLFDLLTDPAELHDLAGTVEGARVVAALDSIYGPALGAKYRHGVDQFFMIR